MAFRDLIQDTTATTPEIQTSSFAPYTRKGFFRNTGSLLGRALIATGETLENSLEAIGLNDPSINTVSRLRNIDIFKPDLDEALDRGFLQQTWAGSIPSAFESAGPSLFAAGTGAVAGATIGGPIGAIIGAVISSAGIMGASSYQQTLEDEIARGTPEDFAKIKALEVGAIEGGGEGLASLIGLGPLGKFFTGGALNTAKQILKTPVKELAKTVGLMYGKEQLTEFGQAIGQTIVLNQGRVPEEQLSIIENALSTIIPTAFMTAGFSAGTLSYNEVQKRNLLNALESDEPADRTIASSVVYKGLLEKDSKVANAWKIYSDEIIKNREKFDINRDIIEASEKISKDKKENQESLINIIKGRVNTIEADEILERELAELGEQELADAQERGDKPIAPPPKDIIKESIQKRTQAETLQNLLEPVVEKAEVPLSDIKRRYKDRVTKAVQKQALQDIVSGESTPETLDIEKLRNQALKEILISEIIEKEKSIIPEEELIPEVIEKEKSIIPEEELIPEVIEKEEEEITPSEEALQAIQTGEVLEELIELPPEPIKDKVIPKPSKKKTLPDKLSEAIGVKEPEVLKDKPEEGRVKSIIEDTVTKHINIAIAFGDRGNIELSKKLADKAKKNAEVLIKNGAPEKLIKEALEPLDSMVEKRSGEIIANNVPKKYGKIKFEGIYKDGDLKVYLFTSQTGPSKGYSVAIENLNTKELITAIENKIKEKKTLKEKSEINKKIIKAKKIAKKLSGKKYGEVVFDNIWPKLLPDQPDMYQFTPKSGPLEGFTMVVPSIKESEVRTHFDNKLEEIATGEKKNREDELIKKGKTKELSTKELRELGELRFGKEASEEARKEIETEEALLEKARESALEEAYKEKQEELEAMDQTPTEALPFEKTIIEEETIEEIPKDIISTPIAGGSIEWKADPESKERKKDAFGIIYGTSSQSISDFTLLSQGRGLYSLLINGKRFAVDLKQKEAKERAEQYIVEEEETEWKKSGTIGKRNLTATWNNWEIYSVGKRLNISLRDREVATQFESFKQAQEYVKSQDSRAPGAIVRSPKPKSEIERELKPFKSETAEALISTSVYDIDGNLNSEKSHQILENWLNSKHGKFISEKSKQEVLNAFNKRFLKAPIKGTFTDPGDEKTVKELLNTLSKSNNKFYSSVANLILKQSKKSTLDNTTIFYDPKSLISYYNQETDQIVLSGTATNIVSEVYGEDSNILDQYRDDLESIAIHEIIHAITSRQIVGDPILQKELLNLFDRYKQNLPKNPTSGQEYAALNEVEFLAQAISDPDVREILINIPIKDSEVSFIKNLWNSFTNLIRKALGFRTTKDYNILTETLDLIIKASKLTPTEKLSGKLFSKALERNEEGYDILVQNHVPMTDLEKMKDSFKRFVKDSKDVVENLIKVSSEQLRSISPKYMHKIRKGYGFKISLNLKQNFTTIEPFIKKLETLGVEEIEFLRYYIYNPSKFSDKALQMIKDLGMYEEFRKVRGVLLWYQKRADDVGMLSRIIDAYFPRTVKDYEGLKKYIYEQFGEVEGESALPPDRVGVAEEERLQKIISGVAIGRSMDRIPNPRSVLQRQIEVIPKGAMKFYDSIGDSLINHIYDMEFKLAAWELLGKGHLQKRISIIKDIRKYYKDTLKDPAEKIESFNKLEEAVNKLQDPKLSIKEGLIKMMEGDETLTQYDKDQIVNIVHTLFTQKGMSGAVQTMKNAGLLMTLGNPLAAITQIGDQAFNIYVNDKHALGGAVEAVVNLDISDLFNWDLSLREFSPKTSSVWLDKVLSSRFVGLKKMDLIGKESFLKGRLKKYSAMDIREFRQKWGEDGEYLKDTEGTLQDLKNNILRGDSLYVLYSDLADFQPIDLLETPPAYQGAGNMRILYMLKTFAIKAFNNILRETTTEWKAGNKQKAVTNFVYLTAILGMAGAGTDEIKDIILRRDKALKDHVVDNLLQLMLMSRYNIDKGIKSGQILRTISSGFIPPTRYLDDIITDTVNIISLEPTFKTLQHIPVGGRILYSNLSGNARQAEYARRKSYILDEIRSGTDVSTLKKDIKKFNMNARRYDLIPITSSTIRRIQKREK